MADLDYEAPLMTRTKGDADELHQNKIVDYADPTGSEKQAEVSEKLLHIRAYGEDGDNAKQQLKLSQLGRIIPDGIYDASNNKTPGHVGLIGMVRNASPAESQQTLRLTAIANGAGDVRALDVAIRDEDGEPFSDDNPLPVTVEPEGDKIHDFLQDDGVAKDGSANHDYNVVDGKTFFCKKIKVAGRGETKFEVQLGDGAASEVFATKAVILGSPAQKTYRVKFEPPLEVVGTTDSTNLRVIKTNLDQDTNLYSTIMGILRDT